ncbi:YnbE family lipoprotein [Marinibactrum halimedae]|uniref:YnbE family lipoprotein n=1 Tax=Marinibactrum halimedae TaxID=1444977 RepID=A0AA37T8C9_9GAMM|nr:YnbE family lipoprotein [Marinibactrum halimedae]MCD9459037.1 YnbE family lipoprotein [Marinibactrum halimedae]GLS26833.1 YnbE family lipoprotein [Marinibactrum halimedae]
MKQQLTTLAAYSALVATIIAAITGCQPTVQVASEEPITINLNVKIEHEIRVKVDKELEDIFSDDSELF